jgi:hypothetical protein
MRGKPVVYRDFSGGVNTLDAPYNLGDKECRAVRNMVTTTRGALRKRNGMQTFSTAPANILSLFGGQAASLMLATSVSVIYKLEPNGTFTSLKTGLGSGYWEWCRAPTSGGQGPYYGVNDTNTPQYYDGSGGATGDWIASAGTVPNGKYILYHANRVWIADGSSLYWSELADPRDWPAANVVQFEPNDGDDITGLGTVGDQILVFKPSKVWSVYDLDEGGNRQIAESAGCVAHRSIVETPRGTFFLSRDQGVMVTDGNAVKPVAEKILPTLRAISPAHRQHAAATYFNGHYYLSVTSTGSTNDLTLDFDTYTDSWWIHSLGVTQWAIWEATAGDAQAYAAKAGSAIVSKAFVPNVYQDNGANFESYWYGPYHIFGQPHIRKNVREIRFDGKGTIQVSIATDFATAPSFLEEVTFDPDTDTWGDSVGSWGVDDTTIWGGSIEIGSDELYTLGVARAWSVVFGNATDEELELDAYTMAIEMRRD